MVVPDKPKQKDWWDKADICGKIASAVVLGFLAFFVKNGADSIANSFRTAELVQKLIADLATPGARRDVALIALDHTAQKEDSALVVRVAERVFYDRVQSSDSGKIEQAIQEGRLALEIIENRDPEKAQAIKDKVEKLAAENQSSIRSAPDTPPQAENGIGPGPASAPVPAPPTTPLVPRAFRRVVYIQFRGTVARSSVEAFRKALVAELKTDPANADLVAPGIERVDRAYSNQVRYFHPEDKTLATRIAAWTQDYFVDRKAKARFEAKDFTRSRLQTQVGHIEVWINVNMPSSG